MIQPAQLCDSVLTKPLWAFSCEISVFLLCSTQIVIYKMLPSWTGLTERLQLVWLFYWPLVLRIFSSVIKTWGCKGCLKHRFLEHEGNSIFLFTPAPKAAEPFSSETAHANCLSTPSLEKLQLELLIMAIRSWEWGCRVGWQFSWPLPLPLGLPPASKCSNSSVCAGGWWGDAVTAQPRQPCSARKQPGLQNILSLHFTTADFTEDTRVSEIWGTTGLLLLKPMLCNPEERSWWKAANWQSKGCLYMFPQEYLVVKQNLRRVWKQFILLPFK